ncbi:hypothetical protein MKW98_028664, partial [Papaver atlanticum]
WDEWVCTERLLKFTEENKKLQEELKLKLRLEVIEANKKLQEELNLKHNNGKTKRRK